MIGEKPGQGVTENDMPDWLKEEATPTDTNTEQDWLNATDAELEAELPDWVAGREPAKPLNTDWFQEQQLPPRDLSITRDAEALKVGMKSIPVEPVRVAEVTPAPKTLAEMNDTELKRERYAAWENKDFDLMKKIDAEHYKRHGKKDEVSSDNNG